jgi:tRNA threonylcarbamoyladenosine biosynthesis protein TsaB
MAILLAIETALDVCSVALGKNGEVISAKEERGQNLHSSRLTILISEVIAEAGLKMKDLQAVAVSKGPGSYTGLRIGVSTAKGLCYGLGIPLIGINTLESMARRAIKEIGDIDALYCPMIDARRMEVYYALYNSQLQGVHTTAAAILTEEFLKEELSKHRIIFFGNGMPKSRELIGSENALFADNIYPRAEELIWPAEQRFNAGLFEDLYNFEPFYLKEFMAGTPKK